MTSLYIHCNKFPTSELHLL